MAQAGLIDAIAARAPGDEENAAKAPLTEDAIRGDERLSDDQKAALIAVYRSMLGG
jgi:hypothetical protein